MTIMKSDTSHVSIAENLQELIDAKADIKSAIESKGVEVTGGLTTYADAIREIDGGVSGVWKLNDEIKLAYSTFSTIPTYIDTSDVTNGWLLFGHCDSLVEVRNISTSKMTQMHYMFFECPNLIKVAELDASNVSNVFQMFGDDDVTDYMPIVRDLAGFTNLGKRSYITGTEDFLRPCHYLTRESVVNVFNKLYDRKAAGYSVVTIKLYIDVMDKLTDTDIAIATNKGWTVSV